MTDSTAQGDPQHACATRSDKLDQDGLIHVESDESEPEEDSSSDASTCDRHEPNTAPGVDAPDLAAILATHDVTQVVSEDVNAPLVTIALE